MDQDIEEKYGEDRVKGNEEYEKEGNWIRKNKQQG
jgi:hypothetical protein